MGEDYDERFSEVDIDAFTDLKIPPKMANAYPKTLDASGIIRLIEVNCSPSFAREYCSFFETQNIMFKGELISLIYKARMLPRSLPNDYKSLFLLHKVMSFLECHYQRRLKKYEERLSDASDAEWDEMGNTWVDENGEPIELEEPQIIFLGAGKQSIALMDHGRTALKFGYHNSIVHEARLLARVKEANNEKPNHVVKIIDFSERLTIDEVESDIGGISLDLIVGKSLEELIKSNSCRDKVLRYGSHLMEGLLELQRAGIWYHRDLRPGNIIVDERSDAAVIIDLGIATDDRNALPKDNRRFGGPNDLVSLGQIMYYIATGKHIFDKSQSMSLTLVRDEIKDYRDDAYSDTTGKLLAGHLAQVDKTVCDTKTKIAIKECLQAKLDDYQRIHEMFKSLV